MEIEVELGKEKPDGIGFDVGIKFRARPETVSFRQGQGPELVELDASGLAKLTVPWLG